MHEVIERYIACWNQTDPGLRRKLIDETWAPDASYTDPLGEAAGRDAIDATIAAVQEQFPGFTFTLLGRLRILVQRSASPFVIRDAVRDTWLSAGIHPLRRPDR